MSLPPVNPEKRDPFDGHRTPRGRFKKGNPGGPGARRLRDLRDHRQGLAEALYASACPEQVRDVLQKLYELGMEGNPAALKEWLDRAAGKPTLTPAVTDEALRLGPLNTAGDCKDALRAITIALAEKRISPETAAALAAMVSATRKAIETDELAARVEALEDEMKEQP